MRSWVRYSISAYLGLLLAGSIASPGIAPPSAEPMASVYHRSMPPLMPAQPRHNPPANPTNPPLDPAES